MRIDSRFRKIGVVCLAILGGFFVNSPSEGGIVTLEWFDSGWYDVPGFHLSSNKNYAAGFAVAATTRNYFVFDLSGVTDQIVGAELRLYNPADGFLGAPSDYTLRSVETSVATLMQSHSTGPAGAAIYADLGDGTVFGSVLGSVADNGTVISIPLNAAAVNSLNGSLGQTFAFGGQFAFQGPQEHYIFGFSNLGTETRQLVLTTVPEPATWIQFGSGLVLTTVFVRSRRNRSRIFENRRRD